MTRPWFGSVVHVEGMDLAGKSTVTASIADAIDGQVQRNSLTVDNPIYRRADELRRAGKTSAADLGGQYVAALAYDLDHLLAPCRRGVQDSTILLRSVAFNQVLGYVDVVRDLMNELPRHPRFGCSIVLTATIEARKMRLDERRRMAADEVAPDDLMVEDSPEIFVEMDRALIENARNHFDAVVVDTSRLSKCDVHEAVMTIVGGSR